MTKKLNKTKQKTEEIKSFNLHKWHKKTLVFSRDRQRGRQLGWGTGRQTRRQCCIDLIQKNLFGIILIAMISSLININQNCKACKLSSE